MDCAFYCCKTRRGGYKSLSSAQAVMLAVERPGGGFYWVFISDGPCVFGLFAYPRDLTSVRSLAFLYPWSDTGLLQHIAPSFALS